MKGVVDELVKRTRRKPPRSQRIKVLVMSGGHEPAPDHAEGTAACWCLPETVWGDGVCWVFHRRFEN